MEYLAGEADAGRRLDVVVADLYPEYSRSSLELLFDKDMVLVDGEAAKPAHKVRPNDKILIDETYLKTEPPAIDLPVIYEDDDVIVIDKPAGVLTHSKGALNLEPTVASFIKSRLTDKDLAGNRAGIIHRLDRGTSGVIITAKNRQALSWLQKQFSQRKVKKVYIAVVEGTPEPSEAIIDAPLARNPKKPQTFAVVASGKPASTRYKVLKQLKKAGKQLSILELEPQTGRTHQLRVHLAYTGHPIFGDRLYGHGGEYMLLHAASLEITLPSRQRRVFKADLPEKFKEFIK